MPELTPAQKRTFDDLLAIGAERQVADPSIVDRLRTIIEGGVADALGRWTETSLWVTKSTISTILRCEGAARAEAERVRIGMRPAAMTGQLTHRAVQMSHTHPGRHVDEYVRLAVAGCCGDDEFSNAWEDAGPAVQSDCIVTAVSRTTAFLDAFPPLDSSWHPRFEDPMSARVGKLVLSARPDLVLGRPRSDGRQTMLLCDLKSGELSDEHLAEAHFYALVSALRHGVPPFRSLVFSLASGFWTDPDIDSRVLVAAAERVVNAVRRHVEVFTDKRQVQLTPGRHCRFCPASSTCPSAEGRDGTPVVVTAPVFEPGPVRVTVDGLVEADSGHHASDDPYAVD